MFKVFSRKCLEEVARTLWPCASTFLRQHYLDQVLGSSAFRAKLSAFVVLHCKTAGWLPVDVDQSMPIAAERQGRQNGVEAPVGSRWPRSPIIRPK
jgi:hypothetical protein